MTCRPAETFVNASLPLASVTPRRISSSQMMALGSLVITRDGDLVAVGCWRVCEFALTEQEKRTKTTAITNWVRSTGRVCKTRMRAGCPRSRVLLFLFIADHASLANG